MFAYTKLMQAMAAAGVVSATDPYFNLTTLLLPGNGTNGAQNNTFIDSSTNNFTITRNGNTTQGTFSPFSQTGWSNYTASGYLTTAANAGFALSGDFTVEAWVYSGDSSLDGTTRRRIFHTGGGDIANALQLVLGTSGGNSAVISVLSNSFLIDGTINVVTNSWVHVAVTRSGTSLRLFVNGVQSGSTATTSQNFNSGTSNTVYIGANSSGAGLWQGYISNLRVLVGTAAYTSSFTPPTAAFATGTTNQQLLVCASNSFTDINTATTAKAITVNGTPSVQAFSPFAPTASYSAATNGGSGYFDNTGDYLTAASNTAFDMGTGDFTWEGWAYIPSDNNGSAVIAINGAELFFRSTSNGQTVAFFNGSVIASSATSYNFNSWNHIAVTRSGTTLRVYLNGASGTSATHSSSVGGASSTLYIGSYTDGTSDSMYGYLTDVRIVKGTAVYTGATLTVPTAPLTAISGTSILLNFTNAGITDATAKNVLETVGNAQVSTTQSKFGGSSMYFDGTGDYLVGLMNPNLVYGSGDMTIEGWFYTNTITGGVRTIFDTRTSGSFGNESFTFQLNNGVPEIYAGSYSGASTLIAGSSAISLTTWTHIAFTRASGTNRLFVNGTSVASNSNSWNQTFVSSNLYYIGQTIGFDRPFNGYIDDLRITKGYARYTANFTPPTQAFALQ